MWEKVIEKQVIVKINREETASVRSVALAVWGDKKGGKKVYSKIFFLKSEKYVHPFQFYLGV